MYVVDYETVLKRKAFRTYMSKMETPRIGNG